ncbi:MAG: hypothetical protein WC889_12565 [Myxococcota bacterium]|jgi:hypothetical protein
MKSGSRLIFLAVLTCLLLLSGCEGCKKTEDKPHGKITKRISKSPVTADGADAGVIPDASEAGTQSQDPSPVKRGKTTRDPLKIRKANMVITIRSIQASTDRTFMDARVKDLVEWLKKSNPKALSRYANFTLIDSKQVMVEPDKTQQMSIPGGRMLKLTNVGFIGKNAKVRVENPGLNTIEYLVPRGGNSTIVNKKYKHNSGFIILVVEAREASR